MKVTVREAKNERLLPECFVYCCLLVQETERGEIPDMHVNIFSSANLCIAPTSVSENDLGYHELCSAQS